MTFPLEFVAGTAAAGVLVVAWLYLVSTSDGDKGDVWTWERRQERNNTTVIINPVAINIGLSV